MNMSSLPQFPAHRPTASPAAMGGERAGGAQIDQTAPAYSIVQQSQPHASSSDDDGLCRVCGGSGDVSMGFDDRWITCYDCGGSGLSHVAFDRSQLAANGWLGEGA